ncbi:hypothetical protein [Subtercola lobariae]|uniref:Secreted protein n=1 Tax=Subtercola lobariae TaxID=1588641 RepID=A0A917EWM4_9MICO|nr:hypothetical protein [Subtercola lobariae]GGF15933.1 hypothetical protein GCM10011399_07210 [Subtercola lobariae]
MLTGALITFAAIVLAGAIAVGVTARVVYLRISRSRALALSLLRARASFSLGSRRKVLKLRVRLNETVLSGQTALALAAPGASGSAPGELPGLFARIDAEAAVIDRQLTLLESETDARALGAGILTARGRVDRVCTMVTHLRGAVADGFAEVNEGSLDALGREVDREVAAHYAGAEQWRSFTMREHVPGSRAKQGV